MIETLFVVAVVFALGWYAREIWGDHKAQPAPEPDPLFTGVYVGQWRCPCGRTITNFTTEGGGNGTSVNTQCEHCGRTATLFPIPESGGQA